MYDWICNHDQLSNPPKSCQLIICIISWLLHSSLQIQSTLWLDKLWTEYSWSCSCNEQHLSRLWSLSWRCSDHIWSEKSEVKSQVAVICTNGTISCRPAHLHLHLHLHTCILAVFLTFRAIRATVTVICTTREQTNERVISGRYSTHGQG